MAYWNGRLFLSSRHPSWPLSTLWWLLHPPKPDDKADENHGSYAKARAATFRRVAASRVIEDRHQKQNSSEGSEDNHSYFRRHGALILLPWGVPRIVFSADWQRLTNRSMSCNWREVSAPDAPRTNIRHLTTGEIHRQSPETLIFPTHSASPA